MMTITRKSRILAAVLALVMILSLVPVMAAAATNDKNYVGYANITAGALEGGEQTFTIKTNYFNAKGAKIDGTLGVRIYSDSDDLFYYDMIAVDEDGEIEIDIKMDAAIDPEGKYTVEFISDALGAQKYACYYWDTTGAGMDDLKEAAKAEIIAGNFDAVEVQEYFVNSGENPLYVAYALNNNGTTKVSKTYTDRVYDEVGDKMENVTYNANYLETLEEVTVAAAFNSVKNDSTKAYMDNLISDEDIMAYVDNGSANYRKAKADFDKLSKAGKSQVALEMCTNLGDYTDLAKVCTHFIDAVNEIAEANKETGGKENVTTGGGSGNKGNNNDPVLPPVTQLMHVSMVFTDIGDPNYWWMIEPLDVLYKAGFINGRTSTTFAPGENITRAEYLKILICALGLQGSYTEDFADVNPEDWFYGYVAAGASLGIVKGKSATEFAPNDLITREEICVMTMRAVRVADIKLANGGAGAAFTDQASIADWALSDVQALRSAGIISGRDTGAFDPQATATRAEAVKILHGVYAAK